MNEIAKQHTVPLVPQIKGELVVVPPPAPTLQELTAAIRQGHSEVEAALVTAVARAIETGNALRNAKKLVGHGNFEDYVSIECRFSVRAAQNYMRIAKFESQLGQLLAHKNEGRSYLTINEALKFIDTLRKKPKRPKASRG